VDHAAGQDAPWLFLVEFCLLLVLCATVIYWRVKHLQAMIAEHQALQAAGAAAPTDLGNASGNNRTARLNSALTSAIPLDAGGSGVRLRSQLQRKAGAVDLLPPHHEFN